MVLEYGKKAVINILTSHIEILCIEEHQLLITALITVMETSELTWP